MRPEGGVTVERKKRMAALLLRWLPAAAVAAIVLLALRWRDCFSLETLLALAPEEALPAGLSAGQPVVFLLLSAGAGISAGGRGRYVSGRQPAAVAALSVRRTGGHVSRPSGRNAAGRQPRRPVVSALLGGRGRHGGAERSVDAALPPVGPQNCAAPEPEKG